MAGLTPSQMKFIMSIGVAGRDGRTHQRWLLKLVMDAEQGLLIRRQGTRVLRSRRPQILWAAVWRCLSAGADVGQKVSGMSVSLVIAEKPSVASDIAKALGGFTRDGDFWVRDDMVVGSAVGHLLEIEAPEEFEVKRGRWTFNALPVLPPYFALKPIKKSEEKLKSLQKRIRSRDVSDIINACDAGREGELIFKYIMQACGNKKPVRRLWLQSMTKQAIQQGFSQLRDDADMKSLEAAARCRSEADWLVGINGTRAMTAFNSKEGGFFLTTVGRVQTPTLALVVRREWEIRSFIPKPYWMLRTQFGVEAGEYEGVWFDPDFKKDKDNPEHKQDRIWDEQTARRILDECRGKKGVAEETSKRTRQGAPQLFDLTSLQREANSRFGFSAKTTLSIAQALYEKHKVLTYPRTDARALPEDYLAVVHQTVNALSALDAYQLYSQKILSRSWIVPDKRVFNNAAISDHFAIIPTGQLPKTLTEAEEKIFDLVVRRFLAQFFPAAEYDVTTRITTVGAHKFRTEGKVLAVAGWLEVAGKSLRAQKEELTPLKHQGEVADVADIALEALETRPPARYTEATLLTAMETAGKKIEDDELRDAMADKGLGTPATRAATIEGLIDQKYMRREERDLLPTPKAFQLFQLLDGLNIRALSEPTLTAEWEHKLKLIEEGKESSDQFMREIRSLTENIVDAAKRYEGNSVPIVNPIQIDTPCPQCGGQIEETYRHYTCARCGFAVPKQASGRILVPEEVEKLISEKRVGPLTGFISRRGFPFEAELVLAKGEDDRWHVQFDFGEDDRPEDMSDEELNNLELVGTCPMCGGRVLNTGSGYACERNIRPAAKKCDFRIGGKILSRNMTTEEVRELLERHRTPLLNGFVSKRNKRTFSAFLVLDSTGKVGFEFQQREEKPAAKRTTSRPRSTKSGS